MNDRRAIIARPPRTYIRGFLFCVVAVPAGCSGTVTPPLAPHHPKVVYLCDYGYHSSLLLPVSAGVFVEYLYGDWDWAALNETGPFEAVRGAAFSSGATLARRFTYNPTPGAVPRPLTRPLTEVPIAVDGDACRRLVLELDARWQARSHTAVYTGTAGTYYLYVRDDQRYDLLHNCNRATAHWLRRLGCRTGGLPLLSHFTVEAPATR